MNIYYEIHRRLLPSLTWRRKVQEKVVYLTFDDGPHPRITRWVMQELAKYNAKATFFVVGENVERYADVVDELLAAGHSIGNHTYHHVKGWKMSSDAYLQEIEKCNAVIPEKRLFRPPFGQINFKSIKHLNEYEVIMWDVLSKDFIPDIDVIRLTQTIKKHTVSGSIAVFHDSEKAEKNMKLMLTDYLHFLHDSGYAMKAL